MKWRDLPPLDIPERLIWDQVLDELGPLYDTVDTEFVVLQAQAVLALAERQP